MTAAIVESLTKRLGKRRRDRKVVSCERRPGGEEVARAAEEGGPLTEGFEVLDSCHKSVCWLKRV
jgi:hypothetical protein